MYKRVKLIFKIHKYILLLMIIIACGYLTGCKKDEYLTNTIALGHKDHTYYLISANNKTYSLAKYDDVKPVFGDYLMVQKSGKWGFIDKTGKEITKFKYDTINPMSENKAVVTKDGKTLIIDSNNQVIYTFEGNTTSYSSFKENMLVIEKDGLFGYLKFENDTFTIAVEPTYNFAGNFSEGYAVVGMYNEDKNLRYSYINNDGKLMTSSYNFVEAYDFHNSYARVGLNDNTSVRNKISYQYLKFNNGPITYLANTKGKLLQANYATDFINGLAFTADYVTYEADTSQKYKWFTFTNTSGQQNYDELIEGYAKKMPRTFLPQSPVYINNCLIIQNGNRNRGTWEILYDSERYYAEKESTYHEFRQVEWNIDENNEIIKETLTNSNFSHNLVLQYLATPIELGLFKLDSNLNSYIAKSKISGNKCGIITIAYTPFEQTDEYCLDDFRITATYVIPAIYDEIIY